jgi:ketosteroid isomerase-like protein
VVRQAGYWPVMSEESTTPDLVERVRSLYEALRTRDFAMLTSFCVSDAIYESMAMGATFEGVEAMREFAEDIQRAYEAFDLQIEENLDLGKGIGLAVVNQKGRLTGSSSEAQMRYAAITEWVETLLARLTAYTDVAAARADAERLAGERA